MEDTQQIRLPAWQFALSCYTYKKVDIQIQTRWSDRTNWLAIQFNDLAFYALKVPNLLPNLQEILQLKPRIKNLIKTHSRPMFSPYRPINKRSKLKPVSAHLIGKEPLLNTLHIIYSYLHYFARHPIRNAIQVRISYIYLCCVVFGAATSGVRSGNDAQRYFATRFEVIRRDQLYLAPVRVFTIQRAY